MAVFGKPVPNPTLAQAIALLVQNQAAFVAQMAELARDDQAHERELAEFRREMADLKRAFAEVRAMIARLPEAVREQVGFRRPR